MWIPRSAASGVLIGAVFLPGVLAGGCANTLRQQPSATHMESQAAEAFEDYRIGPTDSLQITVWANPEISVPEVVVRPDGKISFPLLDDVHAADLTPLELKQVLTERLSEYISSPTLTVVVREIRSKVVYVLGEVARPGPVAMRAKMTVIDTLAIAGGFGAFAKKDRVKVIRQSGAGDPVEFNFDYGAYVDGTGLDQNILLVPGDKIIVP
ncbi:MAG: polysaccharide biosynthesis/export family protein [Myxococcales bacterium]|nr:polysaccharide biosynthesis/export family protein [Myxococcales bacterium]